MIRSDGGTGVPDGGDASTADGEQFRPRYLFPVDGEHPSELLRIVCDLVADAHGELVIASPVVVPEQTPLDAPALRLEGQRRATEFAQQAERRCHGSQSPDLVVRIGHHRTAVLEDIVDEYGISTLVTEDRPRPGIQSLLGLDGVDYSTLKNDCDTIVVARIERLSSIDSILVPIARGPHSGLAIDTGLALARRNGASLELLHVHDVDEDGRASSERVLETGMERVGEYEDAEPTVLAAEAIPDAIVEYARPFDVTVLGAPREGRLRQFVFGTTPDEVNARTEGTVLVAHRGGTDGSWLDRWI